MAITDNLVSYWKLDESSGNAADSKGSNTLTKNGSVTYASSKIGNGASFPGASGDYFSIANGSYSGLNITGDLTVALWAKFTNVSPSSGTFYALVSSESSSAPQWNFGWGNEGGTLRFQFVNSNGGGNQVAARINYSGFSAGTLYHIVARFTQSTGTVQIFVNGVYVGSATCNSTVKSADGAFQVGKSAGFGNTMYGGMDEVGIWSRAISYTEISLLYNDGNGVQYPFTSSPTGTFKARFYVGTGDGETQGEGSGGGSTAWNGARTVGLSASYTDTTWNTLNEYSPGQWSNGSSQVINRAHMPIDTSLLGSGASISAALLKLWVGDNYAASVPGGAPDYFILIPGAQASTSLVAAADHALTIPAGTAWSASVNRTALTTSAYNTWTLNAAGIAGVSKTGYSKLCMVSGGDYENYGFSASWVMRMLFEHANSSNVDKVPYLELTWTNKTTVDTTKSARYAIKKAGNGITKVATYDVKRSVTSLVKTGKYTVKKAGNGITKAGRYATRKATDITKAARYAVGKAGAATKTGRYAVKAPHDFTRSARYAVKKAGAVTKAAVYKIGKPAALTKTGTYRVKTSASLTLSGGYRTRKVIGAVKSAQYVVKRAAAVTVGASYEIVVPLAATKTGRYAVKRGYEVQTVGRYAVKAIGGAVSKAGRYAVAVGHVVASAARYAVKGKTDRMLSASYQVGGSTAIVRSSRYSVKAWHRVQISGSYKVTAPMVRTLSASYELNVLTRVERPARYAVRTSGVLSLSAAYDTTPPVPVAHSITKTARYTLDVALPTAREIPARYVVRVYPYRQKTRPYYKLRRVVSS